LSIIKKITISFSIKIKPNGLTLDVNNIVFLFKSDKKPCKYFYKLYLENIKESPVRSQNKWVQELGVQIVDWQNIYSSALLW
jgi:hypothetical protein